jgi:hypothetical protein
MLHAHPEVRAHSRDIEAVSDERGVNGARIALIIEANVLSEQDLKIRLTHTHRDFVAPHSERSELTEVEN